MFLLMASNNSLKVGKIIERKDSNFMEQARLDDHEVFSSYWLNFQLSFYYLHKDNFHFRILIINKHFFKTLTSDHFDRKKTSLRLFSKKKLEI